ncbi:amino acid transporter [Rothia dentocariosa]
MISLAPTPRTPKGWMRLLLSIVGWAALGFVALGTIVWVFFGSYGVTVYFVVLAYLLIAVACGTPALLFYVAHRAKVRSGEFGTSGPVRFGSKD